MSHPRAPLARAGNISLERPFVIAETAIMNQVLDLLCDPSPSPSRKVPSSKRLSLAAAIDILQDVYDNLPEVATDDERWILSAVRTLTGKGYSTDRILGILDAEGRFEINLYKGKTAESIYE